MSEHDQQVALFTWAKIANNTMPELQLMFAIPNGGLRHKRIAMKLKAEGVKSGVPDICLPVANKKHNGLFIELKDEDGKNKPTDNQKWWLNALNNQGYMAVICYGFDEARNTILEYLQG